MRLFSDTRPVWAAAWIDSRAALKDAYDEILELKDAARRDQLLLELSDLPIEMNDLVEQNAKRKQLEETKQDARLWVTKQRVNWANKFRAHYRSVVEKARL